MIRGPYPSAYDPHSMPVAGLPTPRGRAVRAALLLGAGVFALLLLVVPGAIGPLDGQSMFQVTRSLVERGDATVTGPIYGVPGLHSRIYSKYGPGQSFVAVPLYLLGRAIEPLASAYYRTELPTLVASLLPALATALTAMLLVLAARELGATTAGGVGLAFVYVAATPAVVYATQWFSEALTACALVAAFYLLLRDCDDATLWRPLVAGLALALAVATRLEALLLAPPLVIYAAIRPRFSIARVLLLLLPLGAALAGLGLYDDARFGSALETGYSKGDAYAVRDTHPERSLASFVRGLYGLLLSPGKGLVEYAPPVLLAPFGAAALWVRRRAELLTLLAMIVIDVAAHANVLIRWLGGWSWGPRFLVPVLPLILLLLAPLLNPERARSRLYAALLVLLALVGVAVQAPAVAVQQPHAYIRQLIATRTGSPQTPPMVVMERIEDDYVAMPDLSPILGSWRMLGDAATWTPPAEASPSWVARKVITFAPHTWWRMLSIQGAPRGAIVAACAVLGALGLICLLLAWRLARALDADEVAIAAAVRRLY